jgi:hypothetical protein
VKSNDMTVAPENENQNPGASRYVAAPKLLEILFDADSRPSLRWLRQRTADRAIPFVRCGRRIFFDPQHIKFYLDTKATKRIRK